MRAVVLCAFLLAVAPHAIAADGDKTCLTAKRKVEREHKSLAALNDAIGHDRQARATCVSRSACARYDAAIADGERRGARLAARLSRYEAEAATACG